MSNLDTDEVAALYDDLLATYELEWRRRGHRSMHLGCYDEDHQEPAAAAVNTMCLLSEMAAIEQGERVLALGCGAGEDAAWLARANGATVVGVDIAGRLLDRARETAEKQGVADRVTLVQEDFHELTSIAEGSMDVVWGLEALSHSPDRGVVLEQAHRVLVPDGRVAASDIFLRDPTEDDRVSAVETALGLRLGTIDAFETTLAGAGFEQISVRDETERVRPDTENRRQFARLAHPVGRALGLVGLVSSRQVDAFRASVLVHDLVSDGVLGYYLVTAERA